MRRGAKLSDGTRNFLRFDKTPGGYLVKREWLEEFLEVLNADRKKSGDDAAAKPAQRTRVSAQRRAQIAAADRVLCEEGV
jgi:hypothetical protein